MPDVTVIIATRNRREICEEAVASALEQRGCAVEVIVVDDGSLDDTGSYIAQKFPQVLVEIMRPGIGTAEARNVAARRASAPILAWIDDDAKFVDPLTLAGAIASFSDPRIGAITIPFVNHSNGVDEATVIPVAPDTTDIWLTSAFVGVACAMRRDVYRGLGGCEPRLVHWVEEAEFCVRLHNAGYVVRIGTNGLIRHFIETAKYNARSTRRLSRNRLFATWLNVPMIYAPAIMTGQLVRGIKAMLTSKGRRLAVVQGLAWGIASSIRSIPSRHPVSVKAYRAYLEIRRRKPVRLLDVENLLPPRVEFSSLKLSGNAAVSGNS